MANDSKFYSKFEKKPKTTKKSDKAPSELKTTSKNKTSSAFDTSSRGKRAASHGGKTSSRGERAASHNDHGGSTKYSFISSSFSVKNVPQDASYILNNFDEIVQGVKPLNSRQIQQLPDNIKALSHQLTDQRSERRLGYMNESIQLSSYVRYYTWWNLIRLTRLFSNLPDAAFPQKNCYCLDLGTGPLTVISALWLSRPELRKLDLTWYCLDLSSASMSLGEDIFLSIASRFENTTPWKIIRVKGSFGTFIKQKADFVTCANMFNELDQFSDMPPEFQTKKYFDQLMTYGSENAKFLLIEPGVPKAARTLSLLRDRFIKSDFDVIAPCSHCEMCPMNGFKSYTGSKNKWCNFSFNTEDAPQKLLKLSTLAKLQKERAVLSYLSVNKASDIKKAAPYEEAASALKSSDSAIKNNSLKIRICSDGFSLPHHKTGFYGCSSLGLSLVKTENLQDLNSGDLISTRSPKSTEIDEKSGAVIL